MPLPNIEQPNSIHNAAGNSNVGQAETSGANFPCSSLAPFEIVSLPSHQLNTNDEPASGSSGNENHTVSTSLVNHEIEEPSINVPTEDQADLFDPLALVKTEIVDAVHDTDIAVFADELVQEDEEIEFVRISDDVFMSVTDRMPLPYIGTSQLKIQDPLSGNTPFIEYVRIKNYFFEYNTSFELISFSGKWRSHLRG